MRSSSFGAALVLVVLANGCAAVVHAPTIGKIEALNTAALGDYQKGRAAEARKKLVEALALAESKKGLETHEVVARTRLNLGVVYVGGLKQRGKGVDEMVRALRIDAKLALPAKLAKPAVKKAYTSAQKIAAKEEKEKEQKEEKDAPKPAATKPAPVVAAAPEPKTDSSRNKRTTKVASRSAATPKPAEPPAAPVPPKTVEPPKAVEPATASDGEEPDLPAEIPQGVYCPGPDEVPPGSDLPVYCVLRGDVRASQLTLYYRPPSQEVYAPLAMARTPKGWFNATIPASSVTGKLVQYYVEAETSGKKVLAASGDPSSPNLMLVRAGVPAAGRGTLMAAFGSRGREEASTGEPGEDKENPLSVDERAAADPEDEGPPYRPAHTFWIGLGVGSARGWHPAANLEFRGLEVSGGVETGGIVHLMPEIGWQLSDNLALSVQSRHQFIASEGTSEGLKGGPATSAHAVFARAQYFLGSHALRPFASAVVGGGSGFRLYIPPQPLAGLPRNDTLRGGPIVVGPGVGLSFFFGRTVAAVLELRALVGAPDLAVAGELNAGAQVGF